MNEKKQTDSEKKFILETRNSLSSKSDTEVLTKLKELKSTGRISILPFILNLISEGSSDLIRQEVFNFLSDLKDQKSVPIIVDFISKGKCDAYLAEVIASCWQSRLDYSHYLNEFANCFIKGEYQIALESFTVIEEMIWRSSKDEINNCRNVLLDQINNISSDKKSLYNELIKVLDEGRSSNKDDYPDLYLNV